MPETINKLTLKVSEALPKDVGNRRGHEQSQCNHRQGHAGIQGAARQVANSNRRPLPRECRRTRRPASGGLQGRGQTRAARDSIASYNNAERPRSEVHRQPARRPAGRAGRSHPRHALRNALSRFQGGDERTPGARGDHFLDRPGGGRSHKGPEARRSASVLLRRRGRAEERAPPHSRNHRAAAARRCSSGWA